MSVLNKSLEVNEKNLLNSYFPARTNNKEDAFDWRIAAAIVVRNLYRKQLSKTFNKEVGALTKKLSSEEKSLTVIEEKALAVFKEKCKNDFDQRLDESELWPYLEEMYFHKDAVYSIAPESFLLRLAGMPKSGSAPQSRLADMFSSMMGGQKVELPDVNAKNFLERQLVHSLRDEKIIDKTESSFNVMSKGIGEEYYLPFLSDVFREDLVFLADHPAYMIEQLENTLKLYGYLYTAQLALNIRGLDSIPSSKPLFFILEHETASRERTDLTRNGHQTVQKFLDYIFPYLSVSESLQKISSGNNGRRMPLWKLASKLGADDVEVLMQYTQDYAASRDITLKDDIPSYDVRAWLNELLRVAVEQFGKTGSKKAALGRFVTVTEQELCSTFAKSRGRVGKILVMNQDFIALLTNLAVGSKEKIRFYELLEEFRKRGVYFDKQSQQELIAFYERVGNVERMSDSGDAVYVRKTF